MRGTAVMLVTATGNRTRFGGIAAALEFAQPPGALERSLHAFSVLILRLTGFMVLFVLLAHLALFAARPRSVPVRAGAGGRHDARTAADDHDRDARPAARVRMAVRK